jgi:Protein of unknown function (DUF1566)
MTENKSTSSRKIQNPSAWSRGLFSFQVDGARGAVNPSTWTKINKLFIENSTSKQEETSMKHKLSTTIALVVLTVALAASTARAQTVANGPYYANPSWDQTLPVATRFIVLSNFASNAVLDRETGLVWERSPSTTPINWTLGQGRCTRLKLGSRRGWRFPTIQELASLVDLTVAAPGTYLPAGHPFLHVGNNYWSSTTPSDTLNRAWIVGFQTVDFDGDGGAMGSSDKSDALLTWCVRGGEGVNPQ